MPDRIAPTLAAILLLVSSGCGGPSSSGAGPSDPVEADTVFVQLEGGEFVTTSGDTVMIAPFEIMRTEVTNRLYVWLAREADLDLPPDPVFPVLEGYLTNYPDYPVVNVSALDAGAAAAELGGRLPTLAEMEYAASIGLAQPVSGKFPWGSLDPSEAEYPANHLASDDWDLRNMDGFLYTAPVGSFPLSTAAIADLAGNVAELTRPVDSLSTLFGGSWLSPAEDLRLGTYASIDQGDRARHVGFRIVR